MFELTALQALDAAPERIWASLRWKIVEWYFNKLLNSVQIDYELASPEPARIRIRFEDRAAVLKHTGAVYRAR